MTDVAAVPALPPAAEPLAAAGSATAAAPRRAVLAGVLAATRPRQWVKNVLVVAAPLAAGRWTQPRVAALAALAFAVFTFTAAGCYLLNDAYDVERDRWHPVKRHRPVAAAVVPVRLAASLGAVLLVAGPLLALLTGHPGLAGIVATYAALTTAYTVVLKHVPVVDVLVIAAGFVLRPLAGAAATGVPPSAWFLGVVCAGAVMVGAGKRSAEIAVVDAAAEHRSSLGAYTVDGLRRGGVAAGVALVGCYAGWVATRPGAQLPTAALSAIAVAVAVLRYLWCARHGRSGAPERLLASDRVLQLAAAAWVVAFAAAPVHG